jgi:hypothetical protein
MPDILVQDLRVAQPGIGNVTEDGYGLLTVSTSTAGDR